jgi:hypothetical protein
MRIGKRPPRPVTKPRPLAPRAPGAAAGAARGEVCAHWPASAKPPECARLVLPASAHLLPAGGRGDGWLTGPRARRRAGRLPQGCCFGPLLGRSGDIAGALRATALYGAAMPRRRALTGSAFGDDRLAHGPRLTALADGRRAGARRRCFRPPLPRGAGGAPASARRGRRQPLRFARGASLALRPAGAAVRSRGPRRSLAAAHSPRPGEAMGFSGRRGDQPCARPATASRIPNPVRREGRHDPADAGASRRAPRERRRPP